ncbi:MAG: hypothetical protein V4736_04160 [Bdellovibrionota bacterium]
MKAFLVCLVSLVALNAFSAQTKIRMYYKDGLPESIARDKQGELRNTMGDLTSINAFTDKDVASQCFDGNVKIAANLIRSLIENGNGDGDTFTETKEFTTAMTRISAKVQIDSQQGSKLYTFVFPRCR